MRWGLYFRYCFLRGHSWVTPKGKELKKVHVRFSYFLNKNIYKYPEVDRACANCERVELHETLKANKERLASELLAVSRERSAKRLDTAIKAARSNEGSTALSPEEEKLLKDFLEETDRKVVALRQKAQKAQKA